jgi:hypothetical protein
MIEITARRMAGGNNHEHIVSVQLRDVMYGVTGEVTVDELVDWVTRGGDAFLFRARGGRAALGVEPGQPPRLRAFVDGAPTDDLLALDRIGPETAPDLDP